MGLLFGCRLVFMSKPHGYESNNPIWLVDVGGIPTILKNDGVRQLG